MTESDRHELIRLRARLVVVEHAAMAALELALRVRPEELNVRLDVARKRLIESYDDPAFAPDVVDVRERAFLAKEVDRLMSGLLQTMGFEGGERQPEEG